MSAGTVAARAPRYPSPVVSEPVALPAGFAARADLERIVVDKWCSREGCERGGGRCGDCQYTVDCAVAATLAHFREKYPDMTDAEITDKWIHVKA